MTEKNTSIFSSFLWRLSELIGSQGVNFAVSIILARILLPSDYGVVSVVSVFISIVDVFATKGFGTALIQKKDADKKDFSTVLYFNIVFTIFLYVVLFFLAPFISAFYDNEEICLLVRVLGVRILLSGVNSVQQAYIAKKMEFKKFFFATFGGTLVSAFAGIILAYNGWGAWALVYQYLINTLIDSVVLWIVSDWRPGLVFSFKSLKALLGYGWKILCSGLLGTIYNNLQNIIIGKRYTSADLAYYNKGKQLPQTIIASISTAIEGVMFPAMSSCQDTRGAIKQIAKRSIALSTYLTFPITMGLFAAADSLVVLLLTEKWMACIPLIRIACVVYIMWPVQTVNLQIIKAIGRSDIFLKLEIIKKIMGISGVVIGIVWGVTGIIIAEAICSVLSALLDMISAGRLISYTLRDQTLDIIKSLVSSFFMCILVILCGNYLQCPILLKLIIQVAAGAGFYIILSILWCNPCYKFVLEVLKKNK